MARETYSVLNLFYILVPKKLGLERQAIPVKVIDRSRPTTSCTWLSKTSFRVAKCIQSFVNQYIPSRTWSVTLAGVRLDGRHWYWPESNVVGLNIVKRERMAPGWIRRMSVDLMLVGLACSFLVGECGHLGWKESESIAQAPLIPLPLPSSLTRVVW